MTVIKNKKREKAIRRAKFEKDYKRNKKVFSCITKSSSAYKIDKVFRIL